MLKKYILSILFLISVYSFSLSQEKEKSVTLTGYLSTMQSSIFDSLSGPFINENLLHNRLNINIYPSARINISAGLRNRFFTGDIVRSGLSSSLIGSDQGWVDMSWNILDEQSFLFNTTADRFYIDMNLGRFQATIGRQRINWGQSLVWNPNDIFNAYSFFDFDYIERPGSDAVRLQFFPTTSSVAELAIKADDENDITAAGLFRFNRWGYDIQFLAGFVNSSDIVLGTGWSGAIGKWSFRGEGSWFQPYEEFPGSAGTILLTAGVDRIFEKSSLLQFQLMYCNEPVDLVTFNALYTGNLSSKDLAFSEFTASGLFTWAATPLLNVTFAGMWFPGLKGYFAGPSIDYSLAGNLDFSLIWQHFNSIIGNERTRINLGFLRLKYSF